MKADKPISTSADDSLLPPPLAHKWQALLADLQRLGSAIVAYSGGVDSGLLAFAAHHALGSRMLAVTLRSELESASQIENAAVFARQIGFPHLILPLDTLNEPQVRNNTPERCYYCKKTMLNHLHRLAKEKGYAAVIEGQNKDDENEHRPGRRAVQESATRSPLAENGLHKSEIRQIARFFGLSLWDLPATPCLATRFPYGETLEPADLQRVAQAEDFLRQMGFAVVRVRSQQRSARIEIPPEEMPALLAQRAEVAAHLQKLGFVHISLDLHGYQQGSYDQRSAT
ncbi:MAG: ATP-dependent sacrificial sulfur transferase LarE [Anaerolineae bacterium]|nr:ATP-dependent sacrificial sulfur transferase LarE [Anaerolineae bacterium]